MRTLFWLLDINDEVVDGRPEIRLWGLDRNSKRVLIIDRSLHPYFYLLLDGRAEPSEVVKEVERKKAFMPGVKGVELVDRRFFGRPVKGLKVTCSDPSLMANYALTLAKVEGVRSHIEDDIRYSSRYLIDKDVNPCGWHEVEVEEFPNRFGARVERVYLAKSSPRAVERAEVPPLRVMSFSMVCYSTKGSPKPDKNPVVILSAATNEGDRKRFMAEGSDDKPVIQSFINYIKESDPDIVAGYEANRHDWPYLLERAKRHGIKLSVDRAGTEPHISQYGHFSITGRSNVDFYELAGEVPEVKVKTLENVAEYLGGMKREERTLVEGIDIPTLWEDEAKRPTLLKYSMENAESILSIAEVMLDFALQLSHLVGLPLDHVGTAAVGFRTESYMIRQAHKIGELIPQRVEQPYFPYKGAIVLEPKPGLHEKVAVLDFKSMYPNIMINHNISPDTYIEPKEAEPPGGVSVAPEVGHRFRKEPPGLYRHVLSGLIDARDDVRAELKGTDPKSLEYRLLDARQRAIKITTNACFDYTMPLIIRRNGNVSVVRVGELIDGMIDSGSPVIKETFSEFVTPLEKLETLSFDPNSWRVIWKPVIQGVRHHVNSQVLEIWLKSGTRIKVTPEHRMYVLDGSGNLVIKKAMAVLSGEWLPLLARLPLSAEKGEVQIDLLSSLASVDPEFTRNLIVIVRHPYGKRTKANYTAWYRVLKAFESERPLCIREVAQKAHYKNPRSASRHIIELEKLSFVRPVPYRGKVRKKLYESTLDGINLSKALETLSKGIRRNVNARRHYVRFNDVREITGKLPPVICKEWSLKLRRSRDKLPAIIPVTRELARLIGYYVAEGTSNEFMNKKGGTSRRITWCTQDSGIRSDIIGCFSRTFGLHLEVNPRLITSNSGLVYAIFIWLLKAGRSAFEKSVPDVIINGPTGIKWDFLEAYDSGDGNKTLPYTRWTTVSTRLRDQLTLLTKQLGIQGVSIRMEGDFQRILVHDSLPFREKVVTGHGIHQSFIFPRAVALQLINKARPNYNYLLWSDSNISKSLANRILSSVGDETATRSGSVFSLLANEIYLEQVVKISEVEQHSQYIYDVTVETPHTLFAGIGFVGVSNCYGYAGWVGARWYARPVAEAATAWGRRMIEDTVDLAKKEGLDVIYGDTDSIFVKYEEKKVEKFLCNIEERLGLEIQPDEIYERILFTEAKKRYAGLLPDGRLDIVGLEVARGDWAEAAKKVQEGVLEILLKEKSPKKATEFVRQYIIGLRTGKVPFRDLIIWKTLTKAPSEYKVNAPHVEAARLLMKEGWDLTIGDKIGFVIVKGSGRLYERSSPYSLAKYEDLDLQYYEDRQIIPAASRVLNIFGLTEEELRPKTSIKDFMK